MEYFNLSIYHYFYISYSLRIEFSENLFQL